MSHLIYVHHLEDVGVLVVYVELAADATHPSGVLSRVASFDSRVVYVRVDDCGHICHFSHMMTVAARKLLIVLIL